MATRSHLHARLLAIEDMAQAKQRDGADHETVHKDGALLGHGANVMALLVDQNHVDNVQHGEDDSEQLGRLFNEEVQSSQSHVKVKK